jgi:hypothetical protein
MNLLNAQNVAAVFELWVTRLIWNTFLMMS